MRHQLLYRYWKKLTAKCGGKEEQGMESSKSVLPSACTSEFRAWFLLMLSAKPLHCCFTATLLASYLELHLAQCRQLLHLAVTLFQPEFSHHSVIVTLSNFTVTL